MRELIQRGFVDYITKTGDIKRYFHINTKGWMEQTKKQIEGQEQLQTLIIEVQKFKKQ